MFETVDIILKIIFDLSLLIVLLLDINIYRTKKSINNDLMQLNLELSKRNTMLADQNTLLKSKLNELTRRKLDD